MRKLSSLLAVALVLVAVLAACSGAGSRGGGLSAGEALFVSLPAADAVGKFDAETGEVLRQATVGMLPHNLVLGKDGSKLYVALVGSQAIAEIDVASGDLLRTFLTEPVPERDEDDTVIQAHIDQDAFSKTSCFACHDGSGTAQPAVVGSRPFGLALSAAGETLYVANIRSANLSVIDLSTGKLDRLLHLEPNGDAHEPTALALLGDQLFVSLLPTLPTLEPHPPAVVRRLDLDTLTPLSDTSTGRNAAILLADDSRGRVYVSNVETDTLSLFDADGALIDVLTVGNSPYGQAFVDSDHLLVANFYDGSISLVSLDSGEVRTEPLELDGVSYSNPTHIHLASGGEQAYVVSGAPKQGHLLVVDLATLLVERSLPISGLGFDVVAVPR